MKEKVYTVDRIKGAIYGFAIGDALGSATEGLDPASIGRVYGVITELIGGGWMNLNPGCVSDDTDLMLCVANAIVEGGSRKDILDRCCKNFIEYISSGSPDIDEGINTVAHDTAMSTDSNKWQDASRAIEFDGNSGLVRTFASVILGQDEEFSLAQNRLSNSTHSCDFYTLFYHETLSMALSGEDVKSKSTYLSKPRSTSKARSTFDCSIYWISKTDTFEAALLGAANDGGSSNSVAAIVGSIAGAIYGFEKIPVRWLMQLDRDVVKDIDNLFKICEQKYVHSRAV